jgi:hypothetical protein
MVRCGSESEHSKMAINKQNINPGFVFNVLFEVSLHACKESCRKFFVCGETTDVNVSSEDNCTNVKNLLNLSTIFTPESGSSNSNKWGSGSETLICFITCKPFIAAWHVAAPGGPARALPPGLPGAPVRPVHR